MMSRRTELSEVDREALERCLKIARADPEERETIDRIMREDGWYRAADFACYHCQMSLVRPRLWQPLPMDIQDIEGTLAKGDDGLGGSYRAALLLRRMLRAGLSRYEPDPVRALDAAKRRAPTQQPAA